MRERDEPRRLSWGGHVRGGGVYHQDASVSRVTAGHADAHPPPPPRPRPRPPPRRSDRPLGRIQVPDMPRAPPLPPPPPRRPVREL